MGLADAALIRVAAREGVRKIFTVDRKDFTVYRLYGPVRPPSSRERSLRIE
jgi:predicted nucleic acid-binding protein